jgi:hypothetical protein
VRESSRDLGCCCQPGLVPERAAPTAVTGSFGPACHQVGKLLARARSLTESTTGLRHSSASWPGSVAGSPGRFLEPLLPLTALPNDPAMLGPARVRAAEQVLSARDRRAPLTGLAWATPLGHWATREKLVAQPNTVWVWRLSAIGPLGPLRQIEETPEAQ